MHYIKPEEYDEYLKDFATISYESYVVTLLRMGFTRDKLIEMIDGAVAYLAYEKETEG